MKKLIIIFLKEKKFLDIAEIRTADLSLHNPLDHGARPLFHVLHLQD